MSPAFGLGFSRGEDGMVTLSEIEKEFALSQYSCLREEILERKRRKFRIMYLIVISAPALANIGLQFHLGVILFTVPPLIIISAVLYTSENNGVMRAGEFIRVHIEPLFTAVPGWENWLEKSEGKTNRKRSVDRHINIGFFLLMAFYYIFVMHYIAEYETKYVSVTLKWIVFTVYVFLGILFFPILFGISKNSSASED